MKILLAPSKTRNYNISKRINKEKTKPIYDYEAEYIANHIKSISKEELSKIMKIKNDLLDKTYNEYKEFSKLDKHYSICSYIGTVYKEITLDEYSDLHLDYLESNVRILSALYGILKPFDGIKYYRLDMTMKVLEKSLYKFWNSKITREVITDKSDELIINLSSNEFSKILNTNFINIEFKETVATNMYKSVAIYSKKARGMMANYMIVNAVETLEEIKEFNNGGYKFSQVLSKDDNLVFIR